MEALLSNLLEIDIKRLRVFMTIVEGGGFRAAQDELNLSASAVSVRMSELEERLGLRLCQRGRAGFKVTSEGVTIYDACQSLLFAHERFRNSVEVAKGFINGEFRMGIIDNTIFIPEFPVSEALSRFYDDAYDLNITLYTMSPFELERSVLDQKLHMAIGIFSQQLPELVYHTISHERMVLYCSKNHPLFNKKLDTFDKKELINAGYVERTYSQTTGRMSKPIPFKASAYASSLESTAMLIMTGRYIGFLPEYYAEFWCKQGLMKSLHKDEVFIDNVVSVLTHKKPHNSLKTGKMLELLLNTV